MATTYLLRYQSPDGIPKVVPLQGTEWTIGRSTDNRIAIEDPTISRHHAVLRLQGDIFFIRELSPRNPILDENMKPLAPEGAPGGKPTLREVEMPQTRPFLLGTTWIWLEKLDTTKLTTQDTRRIWGQEGHATQLEAIAALRHWAEGLFRPADYETRAIGALKLLAAAMPFRRGLVGLFEEEDHLRILAALQPGNDLPLSRPEIMVSESVAAEVRKRRQPVLVADTQENVHIQDRSSVLALGIRSVLAIPILWEGEARGIIYLDRGKKEPPFQESHQDFASLVAHYLGLAIRSHELEHAAEALARQPEAPAEAGAAPPARPATPQPVGNSKVYQAHLNTLRSVADHEVPVLLLGEPGSGKEFSGRLVHHWSRRAAGPFLALHCGALQDNLLEMELFGYERRGGGDIRPGRFQLADRGTLLLDEIDTLSLRTQAKILRALESQEVEPVGASQPVRVNVRLLAGTSKEMRTIVEDGSFRQDLYFRLASFVVQVPPLRERGEDIVALARTFLTRKAETLGLAPPRISPAAAELLLAFHWPGNARELQHVMEQAIAMGARKLITPEDLPRELRLTAPAVPIVRLPLATVERTHIQKVLSFARGNVRMAARVLGIATSTLYEKIKRYGLGGEVNHSRKVRRRARLGKPAAPLDESEG